MKTSLILLILQCCLVLVLADDGPASKDLDGEDVDDLGRKHRKKKKHQNNPCYGRTFGEKFGPHDYTNTYISAPMYNFYGCGGYPAPLVSAYPQYGHGDHGHGGHGHGGHGGHGHGGHGGHGHGGQGYGGNFQGGYAQGGFIPQNYGGYNGFQQQYNPGFLGQNRPFQNVVSSAAAGLGNAVANYFTRPRKTYKQINKFINNLF